MIEVPPDPDPASPARVSLPAVLGLPILFIAQGQKKFSDVRIVQQGPEED